MAAETQHTRPVSHSNDSRVVIPVAWNGLDVRAPFSLLVIEADALAFSATFRAAG